MGKLGGGVRSLLSESQSGSCRLFVVRSPAQAFAIAPECPTLWTTWGTVGEGGASEAASELLAAYTTKTPCWMTIALGMTRLG
jgi:hypothetical protein